MTLLELLYIKRFGVGDPLLAIGLHLCEYEMGIYCKYMFYQHLDMIDKWRGI